MERTAGPLAEPGLLMIPVWTFLRVRAPSFQLAVTVTRL